MTVLTITVERFTWFLQTFVVMFKLQPSVRPIASPRARVALAFDSSVLISLGGTGDIWISGCQSDASLIIIKGIDGLQFHAVPIYEYGRLRRYY